MSEPKASAGPGRRIGEVAELTGVTPRTLRYYEELGLIAPGARTLPTQGRRYSEAEVERVRRIREMQQFLGADLGEIREVLTAEDRLDGLRAAYRSTSSPKVHAAVLTEAVVVAERRLAQIKERQARLSELQKELEERRDRYLARLAVLPQPGSSEDPVPGGAPGAALPKTATAVNASRRERRGGGTLDA
jgi:DNA-binding transcriptional MerR regulator